MDPLTLSVAELGLLLAETIELTFPDDVWVTGEISGISRSRAGHVYFDLVEPPDTPGTAPVATLPVVLFRGNGVVVDKLMTRAGLGRLENAMSVRLRAAVGFYPAGGRLQLRMTSIDPTYTLGALVADRDAVLRRLDAEGLLAANRRHTFPLLPLRVGLVTSVNSAAYHDFTDELTRSGVGFAVSVVDTPVQGAGSDRALAAAVTTLARRDLDVICVVRGGGSRNDLAAFDSETLARAIATAALPVLTGIGHEIDSAVADAVAHRAFKTPTACAAALVDHVRRSAERAEIAWAAIATRAGALCDRREQWLDHTVATVATRAERVLVAAADRLEGRAAQVRAHDPARIVARGWSITRGPDGAVVHDAATLAPGAELTTQFARGSATSTVTATIPGDETP